MNDDEEKRNETEVKRVKKVRKSSPVCDNCENSPCIKGKGLTRDNFVPGSKVARAAELSFIQLLQSSDPLLSFSSNNTFKLRKLHEKSDFY